MKFMIPQMIIRSKSYPERIKTSENSFKSLWHVVGEIWGNDKQKGNETKLSRDIIIVKDEMKRYLVDVAKSLIADVWKWYIV